MIDTHRTWAEISLDNLSHNFKCVRQATDDAYGHGMARVAERLAQEGTEWFAVSNISEALELRACVDKPILILGYTPPECARELCNNNISQAVYSPEYADSLSRYASTGGVRVKIHIKIDAGAGAGGSVYPLCLGRYGR